MQSLSKNKLKYIRSIHTSKYRQKYNNFIVEGHKSCIEFLKSGFFEVEDLVCTDNWCKTHHDEFASIAVSKIHIADISMMTEVSQFKSAPEVLMVLSQKTTNINEILESDKPVFLVDDVQDPGNLGTIIRIADWFGFYGVIRTAASADFYNAKVVQASMGSLNKVKIGIVEDLNILPWERVVALDMTGKNITDWSALSNPIVVMGNEGNGVSEFILSSAGNILLIPGSEGRVAESLNVGVSAGIIANHIFRYLSKN